MTTRRARMFGMTIESTLLPGAEPTSPAHSAGEPDLYIRTDSRSADQTAPLGGEPVLDFAVNGRRLHAASRSVDAAWLLRFFDVCDVRVEPSLRVLDVRTVPGVDERLVSILAQGAMPAFVLLVGGRGLLHASSVVVNGRGIVLVGRSGMGKSTVAAMLCARGGQLVTDDVLRFDVAGSVVHGYAGTTELRLRRDADALPDIGATRRTVDGRRAVRARPWPDETSPIDVVVLPRLLRGIDAVSARRLHGSEALLSLLRFPRLPGLLDPALQGQQLGHATRLAARVPVLILDVPWDEGPSVELADATVQAVEEALRDPVSSA